MHFAGNDRSPLLRVFIGDEMLGVVMKDIERGIIGDQYDLTGQAIHDRFEVKFTPDNLTTALNNSPGDKITFGYDITQPGRLTHVTDGSGWEAWIMPRLDSGGSSA